MKYFQDLTELVGRTPLVKLNRVVPHQEATFLVKLESRNPGGSVKDRIALRMIEGAEASGQLKPGMTIVEPTSGNTGISLAWVAAVKGYRTILVMPESMSTERQNLLQALGSQLELTAAQLGMTGAIERAIEILSTRDDCYMPQQFDNPANPEAHRISTAEEIWDATGGEIDVLVVGVGTGGTITGTGEILRSRKPDLHVVAVEPRNSNVLSGGKAGHHRIQGLGAGFQPKVLNPKIFDEVFQISDEDAMETARRLAREEGILSGPSSGANVKAMLEVGRRKEFRGKTLVTFICDTGERYLSTPLYESA